ncbi:hypothetical protein ACFL2D_01380 [Patescibacteria group bacterium]
MMPYKLTRYEAITILAEVKEENEKLKTENRRLRRQVRTFEAYKRKLIEGRRNLEAYLETQGIRGQELARITGETWGGPLPECAKRRHAKKER